MSNPARVSLTRCRPRRTKLSRALSLRQHRLSLKHTSSIKSLPDPGSQSGGCALSQIFLKAPPISARSLPHVLGVEKTRKSSSELLGVNFCCPLFRGQTSGLTSEGSSLTIKRLDCREFRCKMGIFEQQGCVARLGCCKRSGGSGRLFNRLIRQQRWRIAARELGMAGVGHKGVDVA